MHSTTHRISDIEKSLGTNPYALNDLVEFDEVFTISDGHLTLDHSEYGPMVYHDEVNDYLIDSDQWEAWSQGRTGQWGYNGPILHASEFLGGGMARDLLEDEGTYVLCLVEDHLDGLACPAGWIILKKKED